MSYTVDWVAKEITIPQSDLVLISGSNYSLNMADVHKEIRRLEDEFTEGLWAPQIVEFYPTVTLSGVNKPPTVEFINSYSIIMGGSNYNCFLSGYDTNFLDVLIPGNGISVLGNNSIGKIETAVSGLTTEESATLNSLLTEKAYYGSLD